MERRGVFASLFVAMLSCIPALARLFAGKPQPRPWSRCDICNGGIYPDTGVVGKWYHCDGNEAHRAVPYKPDPNNVLRWRDSAVYIATDDGPINFGLQTGYGPVAGSDFVIERNE